MAKFKIVIYKPVIPGNTGSIGRTCVALDLELILIGPYGFKIDDKSVRRAGLDYWKYLKLKEYKSWDDFLDTEKPNNEQLFFFSKLAEKSVFKAKFKKDSYLIFGSETTGLPNSFFIDYPECFFSLPMYSDKIRSLNLSNVATAVAYEAIRQSLQ